MAYKIVGVNEESNFPPRVEKRFTEKFASPTALSQAVDTLTENIGKKLDADESENFALKSMLPVSAVDYGVSAENSDNTEALQEAINAAIAAGQPLELPSGIIKTQTVNVNGALSLHGRGKGVTILSYVSNVEGNVIKSSGSITRAVATLNASAAKGASTIQVASTANIKPGDILVIHDSASYATIDTSYKSGEQVRVKEVISGTQFTIHGSLRGSWVGDNSYTVANSAVLSRINFIQGVSISDLTILAPPTQRSGAIRLEFVKTVSVNDVEIASGGTLGILLQVCRDVSITNYTCHDLTNDIASGFNGYAIAVKEACENVTVTGGHVYNVRHGITTMGGEYGVPHGITVTGMTLSECTGAALDTHAAGEGIIFSGNVIDSSTGGITIRSRDTMVIGNVIRNSNSHAILVAEGLVVNTEIRDNLISVVNGGVHGISVRNRANNIRICNNTIQDVGADGIYISADSVSVCIMGNVIKNVGKGLNLRSGINPHVSDGVTPSTGGWQILNNLFHQVSGSASRAIYGTGGVGMVMASIYGNYATGTFANPPFDVAANKGSGNQTI